VALRGFRFTQNDGSQELLNVGGMSVSARCLPVNVLNVTVTSHVDNSRILSRSDAADSTDVGNNLQFMILNSGESAPIVGSTTTNPDDEVEVGHSEFTAGDGRHVTMNWNLGTGTGLGACLFIGTALVG
jgi:hypothetical protein